MKTDVTLGILYCLNKRSQSQLLWIHHWKLKIRCSARLCYGNRDSISRWKQSESLFSKQLIICFSVTVCVCVNIFRFYTTSKHCREACILLCLSHSHTLSLCLSLSHARTHAHAHKASEIHKYFLEPITWISQAAFQGVNDIFVSQSCKTAHGECIMLLVLSRHCLWHPLVRWTTGGE